MLRLLFNASSMGLETVCCVHMSMSASKRVIVDDVFLRRWDKVGCFQGQALSVLAWDS